MELINPFDLFLSILHQGDHFVTKGRTYKEEIRFENGYYVKEFTQNGIEATSNSVHYTEEDFKEYWSERGAAEYCYFALEFQIRKGILLIHDKKLDEGEEVLCSIFDLANLISAEEMVWFAFAYLASVDNDDTLTQEFWYKINEKEEVIRLFFKNVLSTVPDTIRLQIIDSVLKFIRYDFDLLHKKSEICMALGFKNEAQNIITWINNTKNSKYD